LFTVASENIGTSIKKYKTVSTVKNKRYITVVNSNNVVTPAKKRLTIDSKGLNLVKSKVDLKKVVH